MAEVSFGKSHFFPPIFCFFSWTNLSYSIKPLREHQGDFPQPCDKSLEGCSIEIAVEIEGTPDNDSENNSMHN